MPPPVDLTQPLVREISPRSSEPIEVTPITAFVGPSSAGKTDVLHDILRLAANFDPDSAERGSGSGKETAGRVLRDVTLQGKLSFERLLSGLSTRQDDQDSTTIVQGFGPDIRHGYRLAVNQDVKNILRRPVVTARSVLSTTLGELMPLRALYLDTEQRTRVAQRCPIQRPDRIPETLLQVLHDSSAEIQQRLDAAFSAAFPGNHLRLDDSARTEICLRVAEAFPDRHADPAENLAAHEGLMCLDQAGSGWQSYVAVLLGVLLSPGRIVLIEQPELNLYPRTAMQLGRWLANHATDAGCQLFVTTHSEPFLTGLCQGALPITVVRTSTVAGTTHLQAINPTVVRTVASEPKLRQQRALDSVFCEGVVVVVDHTVALVYEAVSCRQTSPPATRFLHSFGPQHLAATVQTLRQTKLPLAVVAGLDLFQSEERFCELVTAASGEEAPRPWLATRERLAAHLAGALDDSALSASTQEVEEFLDRYQQGDAPAVSLSADQQAQKTRLVAWQQLDLQVLATLPAELSSWVEDLFEDLKQRGIYIAPKPISRWFHPPANSAASRWLERALPILESGDIPADLVAFVDELLVAATNTPQLPRLKNL